MSKHAKKDQRKAAAKVVKKREEKSEPKKTDTSSGKSVKVTQLVRGMRDILPKESRLWQKLFSTAENIADAYGFSYMNTPIMEEANLFTRSLGKSTDVVEKEMYVFEDKDGSKLSLRPEWTASVARAYVTHGMHTYPQPVKVWTAGPMFRHDRPQAGRYRQFHQFDCESLGIRHPVVDAELISVAFHYLKDLGIEPSVSINSIGTPEDRERYIVELVAYLRNKRSYLSEESKKRLIKNPLRVLDSKEEADQPIIEEAPQILDWLSDESKKYFMKVLEYLEDLKVPYVLDHTLVRGLDYYTDTVFELYASDGEQGSQSALGGGGRYDLLIEHLGGSPTPACGFAIGLERVMGAVRQNEEKNGQSVNDFPYSKIFFAHLGEQASRRALYLIEQLRQAGIFVHHNLARSALKSQLELANKYGVTHTIILGQKELQDGTIIIRDMTSGIQEIIDQNKLKKEVEKIIHPPKER